MHLHDVRITFQLFLVLFVSLHVILTVAPLVSYQLQFPFSSESTLHAYIILHVADLWYDRL